MEKSWETLSDPVIHAGGSWALGRFGRLFPSGEDSVEEGESLLLMFLGLHSLIFVIILPTPFSKKTNSKMLACKQCVWECSTAVG